MNFADWKFYKDSEGNTIGIIRPDGNESRSIRDLEVAQWLEEGNTPLPAEENT